MKSYFSKHHKSHLHAVFMACILFVNLRVQLHLGQLDMGFVGFSFPEVKQHNCNIGLLNEKRDFLKMCLVGEVFWKIALVKFQPRPYLM